MTTDPETCELCIVGAGIAGLNALFVAAEYLGPGDRVVMIDRNAGPGGMWRDAYDYVRLHQPHGMFTAGDLPWAWDRPREYLATRDEVEAHLSRCRDVLRDKVDLVERYGHDVARVEEIDGPEVPLARVTYGPVGGETRELLAKRVVHAAGLDVPRLEPLRLSSDAVLSTTPERLSEDLTRGDGPVWVIGGGKTGMDTVQHVAATAPGREIRLVNGSGTLFIHRDMMFPTGAGRWWRGKLQLPTTGRLAMMFDGTNAEAVFAHFRETYTVSFDGAGEQFFFGLLGRAEADAIRDALTEAVGDYLEDVVDTPDGPEMILRGGARRPVLPGSVFVNCTGHLLRGEREYTPYVSPGGAILTITPRSSIYFLSTIATYFATHLLFRGKLREVPLYELDMEALLPKGRKLWYLTSLTHTYLNTLQMAEALPASVLTCCGADLDRWFPLPRRLAAAVGVQLGAKRAKAHCRAALDRVAAEHAIRCGPLGG